MGGGGGIDNKQEKGKEGWRLLRQTGAGKASLRVLSRCHFKPTAK